MCAGAWAARPGRADYVAGAHPGRPFVDLDTELAWPAGRRGRHPLPDPHGCRRCCARAGRGRPVMWWSPTTTATARSPPGRGGSCAGRASPADRVSGARRRLGRAGSAEGPPDNRTSPREPGARRRRRYGREAMPVLDADARRGDSPARRAARRQGARRGTAAKRSPSTRWQGHIPRRREPAGRTELVGAGQPVALHPPSWRERFAAAGVISRRGRRWVLPAVPASTAAALRPGAGSIRGLRATLRSGSAPMSGSWLQPGRRIHRRPPSPQVGIIEPVDLFRA